MIDGQTAGPNWFNYFEDINGYPARGTLVKQIQKFDLLWFTWFTSNAWHLLTYLTFIKPINLCLNYCNFLKQSVYASCYLDWLIKKIFSASIKLSLHGLHLLLDIPIHSLSEIMLNFAIFLQQCKNCKKNSLIWYLAMDTDKYKKWVNAT